MYAWSTGAPFVPQADPIVLYAARLQKAFRNTAAREFIRNKMPDAWHIIVLGTQDTSSHLRA